MAGSANSSSYVPDRRWWRKPYGDAEGVFTACEKCGRPHDEPTYNAIVVPDGLYYDWVSVNSLGKLYGASLTFSVLSCLVAFVIIAIAIVVNAPTIHPIVTALISAGIGVALYGICVHWMVRKNSVVREQRRERRAFLLRDYVGVDAETVRTPVFLEGRPDFRNPTVKYIIVPSSVTDNVEFEQYAQKNKLQ